MPLGEVVLPQALHLEALLNVLERLTLVRDQAKRIREIERESEVLKSVGAVRRSDDRQR